MRILLSRRVFVLLFCVLIASASTLRAQNKIVFDWQGGSGGTLATYPVNRQVGKELGHR
jgi:hypothetical protein